MCPVCTVTVIAGLGISRFLGIDDLITSVWIGGFILSFSFITFNWLIKKWPKFNSLKNKLLIIALMYLLGLVPLYKAPTISKILYGTAVGSLALLAGIFLDKKVREKKGRQLFIYQKVIFPVVSLILVSVLLYFLIK